MIPSLIKIATEGHKPKSHQVFAMIVESLTQNDLPAPFEEIVETVDEAMQEFFGLPDRIRLFPVRRLVPDKPSPSAISDFLAIIEPGQLIVGFKSLPDTLSVKAGLYLINDFLDEAHTMAQTADEAGPNATAPYWHGIMHRREPDYDNARYWLRRLGRHAVFPAISREAAKLLGDKKFAAQLQFDRVLDRDGHWDAMAFIDLCEQCGRTWDNQAQAAARLQEIEMRRLLEFTCRAAQGEI